MKVNDIIKALKDDGWYLVGQTGSHQQYKHKTKKGRVTVSFHSNTDISIGTVKSIEKQAGIKLIKKQEVTDD